jgi:hypothetical protein
VARACGSPDRWWSRCNRNGRAIAPNCASAAPAGLGLRGGRSAAVAAAAGLASMHSCRRETARADLGSVSGANLNSFGLCESEISAISLRNEAREPAARRQL